MQFAPGNSLPKKDNDDETRTCASIGAAGHQVRDCDAKRNIQVATVTFHDEDQGNESA